MLIWFLQYDIVDEQSTIILLNARGCQKVISEKYELFFERSLTSKSMLLFWWVSSYVIYNIYNIYVYNHIFIILHLLQPRQRFGMNVKFKKLWNFLFKYLIKHNNVVVLMVIMIFWYVHYIYLFIYLYWYVYVYI